MRLQLSGHNMRKNQQSYFLFYKMEQGRKEVYEMFSCTASPQETALFTAVCPEKCLTIVCNCGFLKKMSFPRNISSKMILAKK